MPSTDEGHALRRVAGVGRAVAIVVPFTLTAYAGAWLVLGAGQLRSVLAWGCSAVLLLCLGAVLAVRLASGTKGGDASYQWAWDAELPGAGSRWWRGVMLPGFALPALLALLVGLGGTALNEANDAQRIAAAGARVVSVPVEAVEQLGKTGEGRYDDYRGEYEVRLPVAESGGAGDTAGRTVQLEVLSSEYLREGDTLYVAYAPGEPDFGPVADEERRQLEQELSGRDLPYRVWILALLVWVGGTLAYTGLLARKVTSRRLPVRTKGPVPQVNSAPGLIDGVSRKAPNADTNVGLEVLCGNRRVPFGLAGCSAERAFAVLQGQTGYLEWACDPVERAAGNASPVTRVDFVTSDGRRRLQGSAPGQVLRDLTTEGQTQVARGPESSESRKVVDLGASWPIALRPGFYAAFLLALLLPLPLLGTANTGAWGMALVVGCAVSVLSGFAIHLIGESREKPQREQVR